MTIEEFISLLREKRNPKKIGRYSEIFKKKAEEIINSKKEDEKGEEENKK